MYCLQADVIDPDYEEYVPVTLIKRRGFIFDAFVTSPRFRKIQLHMDELFAIRPLLKERKDGRGYSCVYWDTEKEAASAARNILKDADLARIQSSC